MSTIAEIIAELDDHGFADTSTTRKVAVIQDTIWEIEGLEPWPFLETSATLDFAGGTGTPTTQPANMKAVLKVKDELLKKIMRPIRLDDLHEYVGSNFSLTDDPRFYYFEGGKIKVWPNPPAATGRVRVWYLKFSDPINSGSLETDILIPKRHHRVITLGTLSKLFDMEDDAELGVRYEQRYDKRIAQMRTDLLKDQYDRNDYVHVLDPDDWDYDN